MDDIKRVLQLHKRGANAVRTLPGGFHPGQYIATHLAKEKHALARIFWLWGDGYSFAGTIMYYSCGLGGQVASPGRYHLVVVCIFTWSSSACKQCTSAWMLARSLRQQRTCLCNHWLCNIYIQASDMAGYVTKL